MKNQFDNKYGGMTVNERLYVSGLLDKFDKAVEEKDLKEFFLILEKVKLNNPSIKQILESLGLSKNSNL